MGNNLGELEAGLFFAGWRMGSPRAMPVERLAWARGGGNHDNMARMATNQPGLIAAASATKNYA